MNEIEQLKVCMTVNFNSGEAKWLRRPREFFKSDHSWNAWNARFANTPVGCCVVNYEKEVHVATFLGKSRSLGHFVWALAHGYYPKVVDHLNGDPCDNRLENLRAVDRFVNAQNKRKTNTRRLPFGIKERKSKKLGIRFEAMICVCNHRYYLGAFGTLQEAIDMREFAEWYFDFGPSHGAQV